MRALCQQGKIRRVIGNRLLNFTALEMMRLYDGLTQFLGPYKAVGFLLLMGKFAFTSKQDHRLTINHYRIMSDAFNSKNHRLFRRNI